MKNFIVTVLITGCVGASLFAQPSSSANDAGVLTGSMMPIGFIEAFGGPGMQFAIDGFSIGNVTDDGYKFSGKGGQSAWNLVMRSDYTFDVFERPMIITIQSNSKLESSDPFESILGFGSQVKYWSIDSFPNRFFTGSYCLLAVPIGHEKYKDATLSAEFTSSLGYTHYWEKFSFYTNFDLGFYIPAKNMFALGTGSENHLTIGFSSTLGNTDDFDDEYRPLFLYGFLRPHLTFVKMYDIYDGNTAKDYDVLNQIDIRLGLSKNALDFYATVSIPTGIDKHRSSIKYVGITIQPHFSYLIGSLLNIYVDCAIGNIGAESGNISVVPSIGIAYKMLSFD